MGVTYIYKLVDPTNMSARYIGLTKHPKRRLACHIANQSTTNRHLKNWIAKLLRLGVEPEMVVVETVPSEIADEAERRWIKLYRDLDIDIVNATTGGEVGWKVNTPHHRCNLGKKLGPRSAEVRAKLSRLALERGAGDPEIFRKLNKERIGIALTDSHKQKVSESLKGVKKSPEAIAKTVAARKEKFKDPEYRKRHADLHREQLAASHAKAVAKSADLRRGVFKTVCHNGHEYTEENTAWEQTKWGKRQRCKKCKSARQSRYKKAKRLRLKTNPDGTTRQVISESGS